MLDFERIGGIIQPGGVSSDNFGCSVAANDTRVVIGADLYTTSSYTAYGVAYIYDNNNTLINTIQNSNNSTTNGSNVKFGSAVGISDTTIGVVGGGRNDIHDEVQLLDLDGNLKTLINVTASSIAIDNGVVVLGAELSDTLDTEAGYGYLYNEDGTLISNLIPTNYGAGYAFGKSVAIYNDIVAVGAPSEDNTATSGGFGAVYLFNTAGTQIGKIENPLSGSDNNFGETVAVNGSYIYVGSPVNSASGVTEGYVYIYDMNYNLVNTISRSNGNADNLFGTAIDVYDKKLIVGAPHGKISATSDAVEMAKSVVVVYDELGNELTTLDLGNPDGTELAGKAVAITDGVIAVGGVEFVNTNFLTLLPFIEVSLPVGVSTFGDTVTAMVPLSRYKTDMEFAKTLVDGVWKSWTNDAPDIYQGILNIEPGRGYVSKAINALTFKLKGKEVNINDIAINTGYNMLAIPNTGGLGNGYLPRMGFDSVKTIDGTWKSWTKGADAGFQGFTDTTENNGYVYNVTNLYGKVVTVATSGVTITAGDTTIADTESGGGVVLTAPNSGHTLTFTSLTFDGANPSNIMFYSANGVIGKIDYPTEYEGASFTVTDGDVTYESVFADGSTYSVPTISQLGNGVTMTTDEQTLAADTTYSTMDLSVDGITYPVSVAAEYIGSTFQIWKNGDMREGIFAAGAVTITFA